MDRFGGEVDRVRAGMVGCGREEGKEGGKEERVKGRKRVRVDGGRIREVRPRSEMQQRGAKVNLRE
ncbi:MAG: hypothetical protein J7619_11070 [Dyadobacter sp.]|uniref:hypothetical protein n=1 Tax=Dyadobacter sp. TaxID=1914288 RepID=UPI001B16ECC1|nr:hypothetical protein [Dyadobacter sp.]MBO9613230.1 hypothetical protein [Dyadobacter sp.]